MDSLVKFGHVTRGYLGVMIQDITPSLAKEFKLKDQTGALIGDVRPKGPADKAGFKEGDVVLEFNGRKIPDSRHLKLEVGGTPPDTTVPVKILREGSLKTLRVTVQKLTDNEQLAKNTGTGGGDNGALNGVTVGDLDRQTRQDFQIPENVRGVVITEIQPDSAAADAGLKQGDVIQEINRHPVKSAEEAMQLTGNTKDKVTLLRVWSNGGSHYVVVDESKAN
jgi:serine protease Do